MKKCSVGALAGALMLAASLWSYPANALTFHYSFQPPAGTVEGFISGLDDNQALQQASSVTITASPIGGLGEYAPGVVNDFAVSGGTIIHVAFSTLGLFSLDLLLDPGLNVAFLADLTTGDAVTGPVTYEVVPEVPLPAALPLFVTGLGALGLLGWRRKKKAVALAA